MENQINLIRHFYNIILDIIKKIYNKKEKRKKKIINLYNNKLRKKQT